MLRHPCPEVVILQSAMGLPSPLFVLCNCLPPSVLLPPCLHWPCDDPNKSVPSLLGTASSVSRALESSIRCLKHGAHHCIFQVHLPACWLAPLPLTKFPHLLLDKYPASCVPQCMPNRAAQDMCWMEDGLSVLSLEDSLGTWHVMLPFAAL